MSARVVLSGLLGLVAAAAAVLSFAALRDLALLCGFAPALGWLLPVVVDAGAAAGSLVWLGGWAAEPARRFARRLALALLGSSVAANALGHGLQAFGLTPPWWVVVIVSAVAPAVLGAVVHLAVLVGRPAATPHHTAHSVDVVTDDAVTDDAVTDDGVINDGVIEEADGTIEPIRYELTRQADEDGLLDARGLAYRWDRTPQSSPECQPWSWPVGRDDGETPPRATARAAVEPTPAPALADGDPRVVELVELLAMGVAVTGAHAAALFGCSPRTGRRLLTRAQTLTPAEVGGPGQLVGAGWPR